MRMTRVFLLLTAVGFGVVGFWAPPASPSSERDDKPKKARLAILEFSDGTLGTRRGTGRIVTDWVEAEIQRRRLFRVITRSHVSAVLKEQAFQLSDVVDNTTAVRIGKLVGVEQLVIGTVVLWDEKVLVSLKRLDVATGELLQALDVVAPDEPGRLRQEINTKIGLFCFTDAELRKKTNLNINLRNESSDFLAVTDAKFKIRKSGHSRGWSPWLSTGFVFWGPNRPPKPTLVKYLEGKDGAKAKLVITYPWTSHQVYGHHWEPIGMFLSEGHHSIAFSLYATSALDRLLDPYGPTRETTPVHEVIGDSNFEIKTGHTTMLSITYRSPNQPLAYEARLLDGMVGSMEE